MLVQHPERGEAIGCGLCVDARDMLEGHQNRLLSHCRSDGLASDCLVLQESLVILNRFVAFDNELFRSLAQELKVLAFQPSFGNLREERVARQREVRSVARGRLYIPHPLDDYAHRPTWQCHELDLEYLYLQEMKHGRKTSALKSVLRGGNFTNLEAPSICLRL